MAKRKFSKKGRLKTPKAPPDDLKVDAMKTNSTSADDDSALGPIIGGLGNDPTGKNSIASALYGSDDNFGE